jgi:hypothetical protein
MVQSGLSRPEYYLETSLGPNWRWRWRCLKVIRRRYSNTFLVKIRETQGTYTYECYPRLSQRKWARDGHGVSLQVLKYHEGQFVLLKYPNRPPNKLAGLYRGPLVIEGMVHPDLIKVRDLLSNSISLVHTSRLRTFKHPSGNDPRRGDSSRGGRCRWVFRREDYSKCRK